VYKHHATFGFEYQMVLPTFVGFAYFHVKGMKKDRGSKCINWKKSPIEIQQRSALVNPELMTSENIAGSSRAREACRSRRTADSADPELTKLKLVADH
jgi:hypothetical protein